MINLWCSPWQPSTKTTFSGLIDADSHQVFDSLREARHNGRKTWKEEKEWRDTNNMEQCNIYSVEDCYRDELELI